MLCYLTCRANKQYLLYRLAFSILPSFRLGANFPTFIYDMTTHEKAKSCSRMGQRQCRLKPVHIFEIWNGGMGGVCMSNCQESCIRGILRIWTLVAILFEFIRIRWKCAAFMAKTRKKEVVNSTSSCAQQLTFWSENYAYVGIIEVLQLLYTFLFPWMLTLSRYTETVV